MPQENLQTSEGEELETGVTPDVNAPEEGKEISAASEDNEFAALLDDDDDVDFQPEEEPAEQTPGEQEVGEGEVEVEGEGEQPEPAPEPEPDTEQPSRAPEESETPQEPSEEELQRFRDETLAELEQAFSIDEETAEKFTVEPEAVLPQIAAKISMQTFEQTFAAIVQQLPQLVESIVDGRQRVQEKQQQLYSKFPHLQGHEDKVAQVEQMYYQLNPDADPNEALEQIGMHASVLLGITPETGAETQQSEEPTAPPRPTAPRPRRTATSSRKPANPIEQFAQEFIDDDDEE